MRKPQEMTDDLSGFPEEIRNIGVTAVDVLRKVEYTEPKTFTPSGTDVKIQYYGHIVEGNGRYIQVTAPDGSSYTVDVRATGDGVKVYYQPPAPMHTKDRYITLRQLGGAIDEPTTRGYDCEVNPEEALVDIKFAFNALLAHVSSEAETPADVAGSIQEVHDSINL